MRQSDVIVVGAGPAGMAAVAEAAEHGLSATLLDEQPRPGGQIYREVDRVAAKRGDILGADYTHGTALTARLSKSGIVHVSDAVVWAIEDGLRVSYTVNGRGAQLKGKAVVLATGALERPMPVPGWTLPGVMTAGAAQILLKQSGVLARRAVLAGSGPLIYLIAAQMVRAGTPPLALVETQKHSDLLRATQHFGGALRGWPYMAKGMKMLVEIARAGVPRYAGATAIRVEGTDRAEAVTLQAAGRSHRLECDTVLLHHGVVPNTQAARSIGVRHRWDELQQCFSPVVDEWGQTDVEGVFIAGDGAGIGGAKVAEISGRLVGLRLAERFGKLTQRKRDSLASPLRRKRTGELAIRPFLDTAYPPYREALFPADATVICRCEEVTAGEIRSYAKLGCLGPNQTKAFGRPGMGLCQGRYCGLTVTALLAGAHGQTMDETGYYRIRPPLKPVTLAELAAMDDAAPDRADQEMH